MSVKVSPNKCAKKKRLIFIDLLTVALLIELAFSGSLFITYVEIVKIYGEKYLNLLVMFEVLVIQYLLVI